MKPSIPRTKLLYTFWVLICAVFAVVIFVNGTSKTQLPTLKDRSEALAKNTEWPETQANYQQLIKELEAKPNDSRSLLKLAKLFMNEARASGDYSYYNKSALTIIDQVLTSEPGNFEAICLKSMVFLSQHRFAEAKTVAEEALKVNPYNSFVYGLLVDASVEMGDYARAIEMCDKMVSIRPDIRSYSRVSYLREIHGEVSASIDAIEQAIAAGVPGHEDTEWARMVLAHLYEDSNQLLAAKAQYEISLHFRPDYPFALAGLGRIARYQHDYPGAIQYFEKASAVMNDVAFYDELIELYQLNGQPEKSKTCFKAVETSLISDNTSGKKDKKSGHNADYELAQLYIKGQDFAKGLVHAKAEYDRRPENIDAAEIYAWALYLNNRFEEADQVMQTALRTNSMKPERLVKAGIIRMARSENEAGKSLIDKGIELKPYMDSDLRELATSFVKR
ncbi:MAG: tetratricopeptide repeat protein [Saprospiraceae bacterium]|nr:tetratricopeptide repeat protein [Saprospiraceae bacterium]MCB9342111.1 tetratricopeptide repeat protein [Lewinellaceae bacterium]